jgi:drug/metabolite transporter (DMT)-like permease
MDWSILRVIGPTVQANFALQLRLIKQMETGMEPNNSNLTRGYSIALISAVILSTTAIFIRHLTQTYQMPALILAFWRDGFVVITLLPVLALFRPLLLKVNRQHLLYLVIYGLMLAMFNSMLTFSVALNGAAIATVLVYCSAAFTALLGRWLLKEDLGWTKAVAVVLSLGGCVLVSQALTPSAWQTNLWGILTGVLAGLWYAVYSLMGRSASKRGLNPWTSLLYAFAFAAVFLLLFNLLFGGLLPGTAAHPSELFGLGNSFPGWGMLFLLAAGPTLLGFGLYNVSLSYLPSSVTNLIVSLEVAFTALIAYAVLGERLNEIQIWGSLMILAGVVLLRVSEGRGAESRPKGMISPSSAD